ncbi:hypothetical protein NKJ90_28715 [Mesorhizobium sp. M0051]|uniref:hypothetical protein n=1 Tax=unclassified Mesorhizobium TaxID=325217 RepID=UPI0003CF0BC1|nr:hypothetical protein [Mesorhizobium sp. LNHC252B00]ESY73755.1 hypothetical protein X743_08970 [Mesorhizobium sp. LNHC252B00]
MATSTDRKPAAKTAHAWTEAGLDKTPGFDPAAAPSRTDAEAADTPNDAGQPSPKRQSRFKNQASFANAMRPMENRADIRPGNNWPVLVIAIAVLVAAAVFILAAILR